MANQSLFGITREVLMDVITCPICNETYDVCTRPAKFLPCLHSFCEVCLGKLGQVFSCPLCRRSTNVPESGVQGFPNNFIAEKLKDLQPVVNVDPVTHCFKCGSCTEAGTAVGFCMDCMVFLCERCKQAHRTMKIFDGHVVNSMKQMQNCTHLPHHTQHCNQHIRERLTLFCTRDGCQQAVCTVCAHTRHSGHSHIDLVQKSKEVQEELQSLAEQAQKKTPLVREISGQISTEINRTSELFERSSTAVLDFFESLQKMLEERRDAAIDDLKQKSVNHKEILTRQTDRAESLVSQLESACQFVERACDIGNPVDLLKTRDQVFARLQELIALELSEYLPLQPTDQVFLSFPAGQEQALLEFEKLFQRFGQHLANSNTDFNQMFQVDFPGGIQSPLTAKVVNVVRIHVSNPTGERLSVHLDAFLQSPDGSSMDCSVAKLHDDKYDLECQPLVSGLHKLNISASGVPLKGSPFPLHVIDSSSSSADADEIPCDVTWTDAFAKCQHTIVVKLGGQAQSQTKLSARYFMYDGTVSINNGGNIREDVPLTDETEAQIRETEDKGTSFVVYTPPQDGRVIMTILVNGKPIRNRPFTVCVNSLHPDSTRITSALMGKNPRLSAVLNMPFSMIIWTHDYKGKRLTRGGYKVTASITTSRSRQARQPYRVNDNQNGSYNLEFTPYSLEPHIIAIQICGQPVKFGMELVVPINDHLPLQDPPKGYKRPTGIAVDKNRNIIYVADARHNCIHRLRADGFSTSLDDSSSMDFDPINISLRKSVQIAVSPVGELVLLVPEKKVVIICGSTGQEEKRWSCEGNIGKPANIFVSKEGLVIVGDSASHTLFVYRPNGDTVGHIKLRQDSLGGGGLNNACCDHNDDIIVATHSPPYRIMRFGMGGTLKSDSSSPAEENQLAVVSTTEGVLIVSVLGKVMILAVEDRGFSIIRNIETDRLYTSLGVTGDGCFVAFDPGDEFHLDKYSYISNRSPLIQRK